MQYRELGKTGEKISILGFGAMRLPHTKSNDNIDEKKATEILSYGIDNGINIIDTANSFHASSLKGVGNCEPFIGSGAVLFNLNKSFDKYIINDIDRNIIRIYKSFKKLMFHYEFLRKTYI